MLKFSIVKFVKSPAISRWPNSCSMTILAARSFWHPLRLAPPSTALRWWPRHRLRFPEPGRRNFGCPARTVALDWIALFPRQRTTMVKATTRCSLSPAMEDHRLAIRMDWPDRVAATFRARSPRRRPRALGKRVTWTIWQAPIPWKAMHVRLQSFYA